ncbi:MAG: hypothetical protein ACKOC8_10250 [Pirellulales bacterium]
MNAVRRSATLVICGTVQRPVDSTAWLGSNRRVPVTWLAGIDAVGSVAASIAQAGVADEVALDIPPAACGSRAKLRDLLRRGRDEAPDVAAVVLRGPTPHEHRGLLVEHGIGVALVDAFEDDGRGSRRPAPKGWPCRNPVWGLWEVLHRPHRAGGIVGWLGLGGMPSTRPGSLHVLRTDGVTAASRGTGFLTPRLGRWIEWAGHRASRGNVQVTGLATLPFVITGGVRPPLSGSVLRAA